ncbi:hypothetical protein B5F39_02450 [Cloacibacillus sp. An23]|nr:hypothetical protein B5F39_02450 [Cloacibacillus sp. An23]
MSVKDLFKEHEWLWIVAALAIFVAGALCAVWTNARNAGDIRAPVEEIAATEDASRKISETITEAQKQRDRLPEVVKDAKEKAAQSVSADTDDDIARRWNGLLRRYRSSRTQTDGVQSD